MNRILILLTFGILATGMRAQVTFIKHYGEFSGQGNSIIINSSNNYIIAGKRPTQNADQFSVFELNIYGDTLWQRNYGTNLQEQANQIIQTVDGGYATVGFSAEFLDDFRSIYLVKTTSDGDVSWTKHIGGEGHENGTSIIQSSSGDYFIGGTSSYHSNGLLDFFVVKADEKGDTLWTKKYGGSLNEEANSMRQTSDGGFILSGYTESYLLDSTDFYVVKINSTGDTLWTWHYGGPLEEVSKSVRQTFDEGYIMTGYTQSFGIANANMYVIMTNSTGDTLWTKTYGQGDRYSTGNDIIQTNDGGYAITGSIRTSTAIGGYDLYVVKIDALGNVQWEKEFKIEPSNTLFTSSEGRSILQTPDGGFAITGVWFSGSTSQLLFLKIDDDGTVGVNQLQDNFGCKVYPNPFKYSSILQFENIGAENHTFILFDRDGRNLRTIKNISADHFEIERGNLTNGLYFYQLRSDSEIKATGSFVIE